MRVKFLRGLSLERLFINGSQCERHFCVCLNLNLHVNDYEILTYSGSE